MVSRYVLKLLMLLGCALLETFAQSVPGTQPLTLQGDLAERMVADLDQFVSREIDSSIGQRKALWKPDYSSRPAYGASVAANRERFRKIIGAVDERLPYDAPILEATIDHPALVATGAGYKVYAVRWPALRGVDGEGLLLEPTSEPVARVVALPDADVTPEMLVGLAPGVPLAGQFARRLAESGCLVLVPTLIDRGDTLSRSPTLDIATKQTHREFIYRMAFEMGRHLIGYEVQKVLAAVDWFARSKPAKPIVVAGHAEGGLLALYSAAADTRIDATLVSGYFESRQELWREPLYRNVWGLLSEFGDAELAALVAPRALIVEAAAGPEIEGPPPYQRKERELTPGRLRTPPLDSVKAEVERAKPVFTKLGAPLELSISGDGRGQPGSELALSALLKAAGVKTKLGSSGKALKDQRVGFDPAVRLRRQYQQLVDYTQYLVQISPFTRQKFWAKADTSSIEKWKESSKWYRQYLWEEVFGKVRTPYLPVQAYSRQVYDQPKWTGHEIVIPVWPGVYAFGVLLIPKDLKPGERRPVVVCQHGNEGRPPIVSDTNAPPNSAPRRPWVTELADQGFIVYAPQNPYIFQDAFRMLVRKGNTVKLSLFSFILGQHEQTLEWLSQLPFVDPSRIGFYGISYGGKTAVRVPPLLDKYALSICSADFNEYVWKMTSLDMPSSFMLTREYEMYEFDLGNTFNYGEMVYLLAPRPFMVERGHKDTVSIDEWVAYEYAKVRRFYGYLGIPDRTEIEFFNGPHTINGVGTYQFLHRQLHWPEQKASQ